MRPFSALLTTFALPLLAYSAVGAGSDEWGKAQQILATARRYGIESGKGCHPYAAMINPDDYEISALTERPVAVRILKGVLKSAEEGRPAAAAAELRRFNDLPSLTARDERLGEELLSLLEVQAVFKCDMMSIADSKRIAEDLAVLAATPESAANPGLIDRLRAAVAARFAADAQTEESTKPPGSNPQKTNPGNNGQASARTAEAELDKLAVRLRRRIGDTLNEVRPSGDSKGGAPARSPRPPSKPENTPRLINRPAQNQNSSQTTGHDGDDKDKKAFLEEVEKELGRKLTSKERAEALRLRAKKLSAKSVAAILKEDAKENR
jgi:hypothetical protein